jgi:uncharacterized protein YqgC (DUF456 family)
VRGEGLVACSGFCRGHLLAAIVGEYLYRRDWKVALKAGVGIALGTVVGNLIHIKSGGMVIV